MTLICTTEVQCDVFDCGEQMWGAEGEVKFGMKARAFVRARGWVERRVEGRVRDICPNHTPQELEEWQEALARGRRNRTK